MPLRSSHATPSKYCLCVFEKSAKCCQFGWVFAYCPEIVGSAVMSVWNTLMMSFRSVGTIATRSKLGRDDIKWQELLHHFRSVQARHEKARRQQFGADGTSFSEFPDGDKLSEPLGIGLAGERVGRPTSRPPMRRKATGDIPAGPGAPAIRSGALSPLNPRARMQNGSSPTPPINSNVALAQTQKRRPSVLPKRN